MRKYILALILGCGIVLCSHSVYAQIDEKKVVHQYEEVIKNFTPEQLEKITESVDANTSDKYLEVALMLVAASSSDSEGVAKLIDKTTDIDAKEQAFLFAAVFNQNSKVVATLIDKIKDINVKDSARIALINTALQSAASHNKNPEVIETLIKHGADVNAKDEYVMTPLMYASRDNENPEVIETLLKYGADLEAKSNFGTPLRYAPQNKNPKIAELLKKHTIEIIKVYDCPNEEYHHVCGILKNKTPSEQEAEVYIHYYDKDGMKIYKADSPTIYLDPFGKAKFRAFSFSNGNADDFDNYKVELKIRPGSGAEFY